MFVLDLNLFTHARINLLRQPCIYFFPPPSNLSTFLFKPSSRCSLYETHREWPLITPPHPPSPPPNCCLYLNPNHSPVSVLPYNNPLPFSSAKTSSAPKIITDSPWVVRGCCVCHGGSGSAVGVNRRRRFRARATSWFQVSPNRWRACHLLLSLQGLQRGFLRCGHCWGRS